MADLVTIVRATRASAAAVGRMQKLSRDMRDNAAQQAFTRKQAAAGRMPESVAVATLQDLVTRSAATRAALRRAENAFTQAQTKLAANPLPGDR